MNINLTIAQKVLATIDAGLVKGLGNLVPGQMCVEAAVNYALDLPHGDNPSCVAPALRSLKIRLNDSNWSSNRIRTKGLRRLGLAQLGSAGILDEKEFIYRVIKLSITKQVPIALRAAASICKNIEHKNALLNAANKCEKEGTRQSALEARKAAADAYTAAADAYTAAADANAANAAAAAYAANAADAAAYAANAADAAAAAAVYAAAKAIARDKVLSEFAEDVVGILINMKAPGCQWLYLTEE